MATAPTPRHPHNLSSNLNAVETTGRFLVLLAEEAVQEGVSLLKSTAGLRVASTGDAKMGVLDLESLAPSDAVLFDKLSIAVVSV